MSNEGDKKQEKIIVLQKSIFSHLTSDTRLFIATKWNLCVKMIDTVDLEVGRGKDIHFKLVASSVIEIIRLTQTVPA